MKSTKRDNLVNHEELSSTQICRNHSICFHGSFYIKLALESLIDVLFSIISQFIFFFTNLADQHNFQTPTGVGQHANLVL